jgi:hypothetical protein
MCIPRLVGSGVNGSLCSGSSLRLPRARWLPFVGQQTFQTQDCPPHRPFGCRTCTWHQNCSCEAHSAVRSRAGAHASAPQDEIAWTHRASNPSDVVCWESSPAPLSMTRDSVRRLCVLLTWWPALRHEVEPQFGCGSPLPCLKPWLTASRARTSMRCVPGPSSSKAPT